MSVSCYLAAASDEDIKALIEDPTEIEEALDDLVAQDDDSVFTFTCLDALAQNGSGPLAFLERGGAQLGDDVVYDMEPARAFDSSELKHIHSTLSGVRTSAVPLGIDPDDYDRLIQFLNDLVAEKMGVIVYYG